MGNQTVKSEHLLLTPNISDVFFEKSDEVFKIIDNL